MSAAPLTFGLLLTVAGALSCGGAPAVCVGAAPPAAQGFSKQCGPTADFVPIHGYTGAIAGVETVEDAVVLIDGACTGTLIAAAAGPVVLTAGHCVFDGHRPLVAFEIEVDRDQPDLLTEGTVIERSDEPDYALIRLDVTPAIPPAALTTRLTSQLGVIQHPRGRPKEMAEGTFLAACDGQLYYADLDTLVGSSGAAVLNEEGRVLAVHTDGDCSETGGTNFGWSALRLVEVSSYLSPADLDPS